MRTATFPASMLARYWQRGLRAVLALLVTLLTMVTLFGAASPAAAQSDWTPPAQTPIQHVIVIIGENHSFDNVFGTYQPVNGNTVLNLLSEGIVTANGQLGPNASQALQWQATDTTQNPGSYSINPPLTRPYATLPQPNTTYITPACDNEQPKNSPDARFPTNLPNGPYQITQYVPYFVASSSSQGQTGVYMGDPLHRFYQMWQEVNEGSNHLWTWVHQTAGDGNGVIVPIYQGAVEMGYYNMAMGDVPGFRFIADHYAMADNYHQAVMGGTGANHIVIGDATMGVYRQNGQLATPPTNQIENPNPMPGTDNYYTQDGYQGGSYTECANPSAPGVAAIQQYLNSLSYHPFLNGGCLPGAYYLLNNYNPGYLPDGQPANL